ncbi:hypothetical protein MMC22_006675 [Lobaria immixta]|nr:hypothetical protein [Lobaria immixta]
MHLSLLFSLVFVFFFSLALGSADDILSIEKLVADAVQLLDTKDIAGFGNIYTTDALYNAGPPSPNISGIGKIKATLAQIVPQGVITQSTASTISITLSPPSARQRVVSKATGVVYTSATYIGQGKLAGQALTFLAKYEDKYVKTGDPTRYGGWRISQRFFIPFGEPIGNPNVLPASLRNGPPQ